MQEIHSKWSKSASNGQGFDRRDSCICDDENSLLTSSYRSCETAQDRSILSQEVAADVSQKMLADSALRQPPGAIPCSTSIDETFPKSIV